MIDQTHSIFLKLLRMFDLKWNDNQMTNGLLRAFLEDFNFQVNYEKWRTKSVYIRADSEANADKTKVRKNEFVCWLFFSSKKIYDIRGDNARESIERISNDEFIVSSTYYDKEGGTDAGLINLVGWIKILIILKYFI